MIVQFNVNLGSTDAAKVGLDFRQCLQGLQVECDGAAGKWLVDRGIACDVTPTSPPKPQPAPEPEVAGQDDLVPVEIVADPVDPKPAKKK